MAPEEKKPYEITAKEDRGRYDEECAVSCVFC